MILDIDLAYVVATARFRIGIQRLWVDSITGQHFLEIRNRTYHSIVPVPADAAMRYEKALRNANSYARPLKNPIQLAFAFEP